MLKKISFVSLLGVLFLFLGCDFNVSLDDERRVLEKVEGVVDCRDHVLRKADGTVRLQLFLVDNRGDAVDLYGIDERPFSLSGESFALPSSTIEVHDTATGERLPPGALSLSIEKESFSVHSNPRYDELLMAMGTRRVPQAATLLLDLSETAHAQDPRRTRFAAAATWLLEAFHADATRGDLDLVSVLLLHNGRLDAADNFFWGKKLPDAEPLGDLVHKGFVLTTRDAKDRASELLVRLSPSLSSGTSPLLDGIEAAALELRKISRVDQEPLWNPMLVAFPWTTDMHNGTPKAQTHLQRAKAALQGKLENDFIPLFIVPAPRPTKIPQTRWDEHLTQMCELSQTPGDGDGLSWGTMAPPWPASQRPSQTMLHRRLMLATYAAKGHISLKLRVQLARPSTGRSLRVSFALSASLLGVTTPSQDPQAPLPPLPRMTFLLQP